MPVMAAGMHLAGHGGGVRQPGFFLDRQRVHVGAQPNAAIAVVLALQFAHHAGAAEAAMHGDAPALQQVGDDARGAHLLEADFGMGVKIVANGDEFVLILLDLAR